MTDLIQPIATGAVAALVYFSLQLANNRIKRAKRPVYEGGVTVRLGNYADFANALAAKREPALNPRLTCEPSEWCGRCVDCSLAICNCPGPKCECVKAESGDRVLIARRLLWLAWYPRRGRRCQVEWKRHDTQNNRYHLTIAVGPLYFQLGPGVPKP